MTTKEAITELDDLVIKQARIGLFNVEVEALQHAIEVLKRYEIISKQPKATMKMDSNLLSITIREEDAVVRLIQENQELKDKLKRFDGVVQVKLAWHEELDIPILCSIDEPYNEVEADIIYAIPRLENE